MSISARQSAHKSLPGRVSSFQKSVKLVCLDISPPFNPPVNLTPGHFKLSQQDLRRVRKHEESNQLEVSPRSTGLRLLLVSGVYPPGLFRKSYIPAQKLHQLAGKLGYQCNHFFKTKVINKSSLHKLMM